MYKQINSSKQIAKLIEENYKIFNQKSELTLKFSQAQKSISKNEDFLNQLEENRSKIQYSFKQFSKQENQTYYKYTTSINLKDFPPLEPLLTKKVKAITNKSKLQNFNSKISQNEFEEKETSKECIFNNKQSENEKNTSIVSTQQINFTSPQTQVLQIDSTPLKISLSTEDFCTKQISKESPKFSQNSQYNPQFNVSQSSIYYADELQLLNKEFNYIQNVQNSSSQTFKEEEKINKITQLPINMVQNQNQYNYYQQANLSNSNYIYQNDILSNIKIDSQKVAENQLPNLYRYNQLPIQQQIQYNHFNQQQISHLFSNVQITQQQQLYLYQQQQNNYLQELNIQQQIYNNQNTMNNMNELNKQQFFGTVMPSQHTPHQLFYNNNQQIQNLHQPNYIKQQSASFFI